MKNNNDIKAPDGYLLGGRRLVRKDGTILFQRGYWQAKKDWVGEMVWVHEHLLSHGYGKETYVLEAAPPGEHIYSARISRTQIICERTERPDAKPAFRRAEHKAWAARMSEPSNTLACKECGGDNHPHEAACIHCGTAKEWAA